MPSNEANEVIWDQLHYLHTRFLHYEDDKEISFYPPGDDSQRQRFAIATTHVDGTMFYVGDYDFAFPLYSISKVFTYAMALEDNGREATLRRVGVEPSGEAFNAFVFDERNNRPSNPMVNAGALVTSNLIQGTPREKVERIVEKLRIYSGNDKLKVDEELLDVELHHYNDRNIGLGYLMRSLGMIEGDVYEIVKLYLAACCVRITAQDLGIMGATLANGGVNPLTGQRALESRYVRDVITVMSTCGMYDAAGEWAYDVGIPAKGSVSGAILVAMPHNFGGGFFSPGLDVYGNSIRGVAVCSELSDRFGLHVFADPSEGLLGSSEEIQSR